MADVVQRELHAFASDILGMSAEEMACLTPAQSESLLKKKLACETKDAAKYVCSVIDVEGAQRIRDWSLATSNPSPPSFYRYVFGNAAVKLPLPEAVLRFKEHVGSGMSDALALRLFHAVNFGCPRDEMLDAAGNNRSRANDISNQVDFYREHVEGGDRRIIQEDWAQFLKNGIAFPFFYDNQIVIGAAAPSGGTHEKVDEITEELEPIDKPIPFDDAEYVPEPVSIAKNPLLDAYRKRAGVPLTFPLLTAAKQLVSALVCKQVPASYLHRDQDFEDVSNAVHGLPHLTRENFAPLVKATIDVGTVRDAQECREYYWQRRFAKAPGAFANTSSDSAELVADVAWNYVQQKKILNWVV
jgi:hypothetical protein